MYVVATAGHVDHGKSTLVRTLTGMEPDRWAEERRRGLTIDLGFAWTQLRPGVTVAFVDVPGHERFVPNMLAGIGPVPAALFVVAADEGWMPQSAEHLAALHALDVRHGLCVITRSDLADPGPAIEQARTEIARTSLGDVETVAVSAPAGTGMAELRAALDRLVTGLPRPDVDAPVRLWVDRSFSVRGSGTVVTGTLAAGRLRVGDELEVVSLARTARVRALQALHEPVSEVDAMARVAVNLRGIERHELRRGDALLTPDQFHLSDTIDVRVHGDPAADLPRSVMLHFGSAAVPARVRPIGADTARLSLAHQLPLRIGDRGLLRNPGAHHIGGGLTVLDVAPPALARRGAAVARARILDELDGHADERSELRRRGIVRQRELRRMGVLSTIDPVQDDWLVDDRLWARLREKLPRLVSDWHRERPLEAGPPVDVVRQALRLPDRSLVHALVSPPLTVQTGRVVRAGQAALPAPIARALEKICAELTANPFAAPATERLTQLGLGPRELGAAVRAGALLRIADGVVLLPGSIEDAATLLSALPQPFTVSQARQALGTTRRVAVPLLEILDRNGLTLRLPDDRRRIRR
ncbi:selenocysteine-specific translation elongation factor [Amycolatopsis alkalitolerans]|uniref:Selenocysteine-specific elongation factor n=1 Tax=Amycolatopsis alkalitolerans TaxID=2547244 RepID=A0A5C4M0B5_9PSEU|nr:selenocysteine-specific translation elongation factor [Amycolatopsis alkalitolerans]TNC25083.1 selenocysteine-specific translation elongation factor [Amycolatopsis alkalitolerans]